MNRRYLEEEGKAGHKENAPEYEIAKENKNTKENAPEVADEIAPSL